MKLETRLKEPSATNKNYISYKHNGFNYCIEINKETGSCLPNCVG